MKNLITPAQIIINDLEKFSKIEFHVSYFLNELESNLGELDTSAIQAIEDKLINIYEKMEVNMDEVKNIEEYGIHLTNIVNKLEDLSAELQVVINEYQITKISIYLNS